MTIDAKQHDFLQKVFSVTLPRWPQLIIVGKDVTIEQAKEIIFRTDNSLMFADEYNDKKHHEFNSAYVKAAGFEKLENTLIGKDGQENKIYDNQKYETFLNKIDFINLAYVYNRFAATAFVYGPAGFCHPNGKIHFTHNIGKNPSVQDVFEDFSKLAKAFPFLDMKASLYSDEECVSFEEGKKFILGFIIKNGTVEITFEDLGLENQVSSLTENGQDAIFSKIMLSVFEAKHGLPKEWYIEFANRINNAIESVNNPVLI